MWAQSACARAHAPLRACALLRACAPLRACASVCVPASASCSILLREGARAVPARLASRAREALREGARSAPSPPPLVGKAFAGRVGRGEWERGPGGAGPGRAVPAGARRGCLRDCGAAGGSAVGDGRRPYSTKPRRPKRPLLCSSIMIMLYVRIGTYAGPGSREGRPAASTPRPVRACACARARACLPTRQRGRRILHVFVFVNSCFCAMDYKGADECAVRVGCVQPGLAFVLLCSRFCNINRASSYTQNAHAVFQNYTCRRSRIASSTIDSACSLSRCGIVDEWTAGGGRCSYFTNQKTVLQEKP